MPSPLFVIGPLSWKRATVFVLAAWLVVGILPELYASTKQSPDARGFEIRLGFEGQAKLGCWQPFLIRTPDNVIPSHFEFTTLDGDDTPITYRGELNPVGTELNRFQGWMKIGRAYGSARIRLFDVHKNQVGDVEFPLLGPGSNGVLHKATKRVILTLESGRRLSETIEASSQLVDGEAAEIAINIGSPVELPEDWFCYEGIDTILLTTSDDSLMKQISQSQWDAIAQWVTNGGRLIVSSADNSSSLLETTGALARFCPGEFAGPGEIRTSGRLEAFANNDQLIERGDPPIPVATFTGLKGRILLLEGDVPLIIKRSAGLGQITFVAFDLDADRICQWQGFSNLLNRLVTILDSKQSVNTLSNENLGGSVSHFGYTDLVGQLRFSLDRFSQVGFVAFTWIAVLIGLYILLIGPADYFFLRKLLGKMELTWITFPIISLIFCGLAIAISRSSRPDQIQINQLEIIDIDSESQWTRGAIWSNLYSPRAGSLNVAAADENSLGIKLDSSLISWQGLPGDGLGGMQTKRSTGLSRPGYRQQMKSTNEELGFYSSSLQGMPIYVSSTKALFTMWNGRYPEMVRSRLVFSPRSSRLEGTITNPFDLPLTNVRLFFQNYAYVLKRQELQPGETIDLLSETKERTVRSLLTRRSKKSEKDNRSHNVPWNPTDTRVNRIADMMMFFDVAGGENYTGLTHDFQDFIDLTGKLDLGTAILVGQVDSLGTSIEIDGQRAADNYDHTSTILRIILPVEFPAQNN